jgi:hypothetical protein
MFGGIDSENRHGQLNIFIRHDIMKQIQVSVGIHEGERELVVERESLGRRVEKFLKEP